MCGVYIYYKMESMINGMPQANEYPVLLSGFLFFLAVAEWLEYQTLNKEFIHSHFEPWASSFALYCHFTQLYE